MKLSGVVILYIAIVSGVSAFQLRHVRAFSRAVPKLFSVVNIDENAPRDILTMDEWCTACGVQRAEGFQLTMTSDDGLDSDVSVMTTQDLPANSPVLFVPSQMILSSDRAVEELGRVEVAGAPMRQSQQRGGAAAPKGICRSDHIADEF